MTVSSWATTNIGLEPPVGIMEGIATPVLLLDYKREKGIPVPPFSGASRGCRVVNSVIIQNGPHRRAYVVRPRATLRAWEIIRGSAKSRS